MIKRNGRKSDPGRNSLSTEPVVVVGWGLSVGQRCYWSYRRECFLFVSGFRGNRHLQMPHTCSPDVRACRHTSMPDCMQCLWDRVCARAARCAGSYSAGAAILSTPRHLQLQYSSCYYPAELQLVLLQSRTNCSALLWPVVLYISFHKHCAQSGPEIKDPRSHTPLTNTFLPCCCPPGGVNR